VRRPLFNVTLLGIGEDGHAASLFPGQISLSERTRWVLDVKSPKDLSFQKCAHDRLVVGSPDDCLAQLRRWQEEITPDYLILRIRQPGGPSHQRTLDAIRLFGDRVIPNL
jgi:alkanesulfonate monooxygenase SsuD/methylene tetrahydromethanopterin reductase-like flavin-dependent oxidoreductase (luciferase family)